MTRLIKPIILSMSVAFIFAIGINKMQPEIETENVVVMNEVYQHEPPISEIKTITKTVETVSISEDELTLLALVTAAEAEGESELGKRLVIDTILNRVDSEYFPDTIEEVILQPGQFSSMHNGRVDRCDVQDDICELIMEELQSRQNTDVIFFRSGGMYSSYGTPMFQEGNHYFSSY